MTRLRAGPIAPPAAASSCSSVQTGTVLARRVEEGEGTISGAVAWPTGSPSMRACTLIDSGTVKRGRRSWRGWSPTRLIGVLRSNHVRTGVTAILPATWRSLPARESRLPNR